MHRPIGIRRKIWAVFIQQMAAISLAGLLGVYVAASLIENLILREIVVRETAQFTQRQADDPNAPPPQNSFVRGYLRGAAGDVPELPAEIAALPPGYCTARTPSGRRCRSPTRRPGGSTSFPSSAACTPSCSGSASACSR